LDNKYLVALWCGNAHNESIEGLTGVSYAVPLMKEVFDQLSIRPLQVLPQAKQTLQICASSGYRASHFCKPGQAIAAQTSYFKSPQCRLCQPVAVDSLEEFRYVDNCITGYYKLKNYFVLPPAMEYFYVKKNNSYPYMPPLHPNCVADHQMMEIISPAVGEKIFLPKKLDGSKTYVVIKAYHRIKNERITWFVNGTKLGETHAEHQWALPLEAGDIQVTLLDSKGHYLDHTFQVLERF
jgi:penicillin-binding protein 1C